MTPQKSLNIFLAFVICACVGFPVVMYLRGTPDAPAPAPASAPKAASLSGVPPLNSDIAQTEIADDFAPTPLVFTDAGSGTPTAWSPPSGRQPKGILLDSPTGATKGTVVVDMLGNGGVTGATAQSLPLQTNVVHRIAVTRIYSTNIADGGLVPYVAY